MVGLLGGEFCSQEGVACVGAVGVQLVVELFLEFLDAVLGGRGVGGRLLEGRVEDALAEGVAETRAGGVLQLASRRLRIPTKLEEHTATFWWNITRHHLAAPINE